MAQVARDKPHISFAIDLSAGEVHERSNMIIPCGGGHEVESPHAVQHEEELKHESKGEGDVVDVAAALTLHYLDLVLH